jgi:hypothetical protein
MITVENDTNPVRLARFAHNKIIIIDGTTVLTGSLQRRQAFEENVYLLGEAAGLGVGFASGERCGLCRPFSQP